jgi:hypothetical protein
MTKRIHVAATKDLIKELVGVHGVSVVSKDWQGTPEEFMQQIDADPREVFVIGKCDNVQPDGSCGGHEVCPACEGDGKVRVPCGHCKGKGVIDDISSSSQKA